MTSKILIEPLDVILARGVPEIEWGVHNIVPKSGTVILGGTSGSYKTWTAMHLALCCASGNKFLGQFETKKCKVLYIDEENGYITIPNRFQKLINGNEVPLDSTGNIDVSIFNYIKLDDHKPILPFLVQKQKPGLVIIDSMVRCMVGEEDKAKDVRKIFDGLKPIMVNNPELAIVILHHTTKSGTANMQSLRGSGDFSAFADVILMFEARKTYASVKMVKNRHLERDALESFAITVSSTDNGVSMGFLEQGEDEKNATLTAAEDLETWFREQEITHFKSSQAIGTNSKLGHSRNATYGALKQLKKDKVIIKQKAGQWVVNRPQVIDLCESN